VAVWWSAGSGRRRSKACSAVSSVRIVRARSAARTSAACRRVRSNSRACSSAWTRSPQPRHRPVLRLIGASPHDRMMSAAAGPDRTREDPRSGSAIAQGGRRPGLAVAGRPGSGRRAGSDGSWRSTRRRPGRPRQRSRSAVAAGGHRPAAERTSPGCAYPKCVTACDAAMSRAL
jgi:hypothetical protein